VTPNFAVELSYRYLNVGNARSGTLLNLDPTVSPNTFAPVTFHQIQSHDIMLGVRWMLQQDAPQPLYAPRLRSCARAEQSPTLCKRRGMLPAPLSFVLLPSS
jgi:hypothetical protein